MGVVEEQRKMHVDHSKLNALMQAEQVARRDAERKHKDVEADMQRLQRDHAEQEALLDAERIAKEELERKHRVVVQAAAELLRADVEKLRDGKELGNSLRYLPSESSLQGANTARIRSNAALLRLGDDDEP